MFYDTTYPVIDGVTYSISKWFTLSGRVKFYTASQFTDEMGGIMRFKRLRDALSFLERAKQDGFTQCS